MSYIGNIPAENYASFLTETFTVSATASYTLSHAVSNENDIRLVINGVVQQPGSGKAYTASGTTLTLTSATVSGDVMYAVYLGRALQTVNPPNASVGSAQIADSLISGKTALGATPADTDELLISDAGTLKRVDYSYLKSANTPAFSTTLSGNVSLSNNTTTKLTFDTEVYDSGSVFASNKFTPGVVGKYIINAGASFDADTNDNLEISRLYLYKNGSEFKAVEILHAPNKGRVDSPSFSHLIDVTSTSDYFEIYARMTCGSTTSGLFIQGNTAYSYFNGYKLIT